MTIPSAAEEEWHDIQLYGGAMQARLPMRFKDVSDFRPVPDHQEVHITSCKTLQMSGYCAKRIGDFACFLCLCWCFEDVQVWADGASDQSVVIEVVVSGCAQHHRAGCF